MSEIVKLRSRVEIDEAAAAWTWRMDSGDVTAEDKRTFNAWLRQDPRHRLAMEELSKVWGALDGLAKAKHGEKIATFAEAAKQARPSGRQLWWPAVAASIAIAIAGAVWFSKGSEVQTLETAVGQQRHITLADGSVVTLNTNSVLDTDFSRRVRQIYLRKGEAHFQVAHDRSRPFFVHAGDAVVRAVGTEFEVRIRTDQHVNVLVNEGRVEVQTAAPTPPSAVPGAQDSAMRPANVRALSAGEKLSTATVGYAVIPINPAQLSSELAWREGAVIFDRAPLSDAIAEIERYTDARIIVSDSRIAAMPVGGRFRTGDVQGFLDGLETALPVTIRRAAAGLVYIDARR